MRKAGGSGNRQRESSVMPQLSSGVDWEVGGDCVDVWWGVMVVNGMGQCDVFDLSP